jgi:pilus assembly protein Flp/PilA
VADAVLSRAPKRTSGLRYSLSAMSKLWHVRLALGQRGQGMVEYALILVLVAIVVIAGLTALGAAINGKFTQITGSLGA